MHKWAICSIAMLTGESVGNHLNWINQPVTGPTLCQLSVPSNRPITLPRGANGASHANQYTLRVIFNLSWCERYIYVVLSLSLHTACIHVYQILYILITKKLPTHISIRIHIYIIYILYMIDGTVNGQEARTQQITVDTENPPFVDHFPCRCVCHIYGNSIMAIYWTAKAHHVKDSLRCLRESSSQHKICHLLIKPCPHACFLRGIAFVNWSDPFSRLQAICGINGDTRGIPQMHGS